MTTMFRLTAALLFAQLASHYQNSGYSREDSREAARLDMHSRHSGTTRHYMSVGHGFIPAPARTPNQRQRRKAARRVGAF